MSKIITLFLGSVLVCLLGTDQSFAFERKESIIIKGLEEDPYLPFAETMPEPVGGLEAVYKKIKYPEVAKKMSIQGKVYLLIFINESGSVDDVKVIKGIGYGCDEAAVSAVKNLKYSPGKNAGAAVKVKMSLSINFKI